MAGSRAASAREPGQIREEAALSDTARAPRTSLAGADDRRARPSAGLEDGCTVHTLGRTMADEDSLGVARLLIERWNRGDVDGVLDLFADDASMYPGAEWPEQATYHGRDGISENIDQWRSRLGVEPGGGSTGSRHTAIRSWPVVTGTRADAAAGSRAACRS